MVRSAHSSDRGEPSVRLAPILGALSLATDLGVGLPPESALRMSVCAVRVGAVLGLAGSQLSDVYYASLLRYLGCSGYAHEEAAVSGGDDLSLLPALELADPTRPREVMGAALRRLAPGQTLLVRAGAVMRFLSDPGGYAKLARSHCDQAVALAQGLQVGPEVTRALGELYERFDGRGPPQGLAGAEISMAARILALAGTVESQQRLMGGAAAIAAVRTRRGGQIDPEVATAFLDGARDILASLALPSVWDQFLAAEPAPARLLSVDSLDAVALAFAQYVDLKSPFTLGHSTGVAALASASATECGLDAAETASLRRAALLHDLGRVSVPNGIWDKPGALNSAEHERVRLHAYHGERVLAQAPELAGLAAIVGRHHERSDGSGYHRGLGAPGLTRSVHLLAASDIYQAMTEARAFRPARGAEAAAAALAEEARQGRLDREAVSAVLRAAGHRRVDVRPPLPDGLTEREAEVLQLLARGLSNKEIGRALHISAVTAKNHVAHIYEKTGVATRAAAALYAVTRRLVDT
jgi:HD-GYP domain-containing protein (c-di-GMP phosphodiesterase class II)